MPKNAVLCVRVVSDQLCNVNGPRAQVQRDELVTRLKSVRWVLAEFYFNRGLQRLYTGTLQKTINAFLCLLIVFLKSKTHQLSLKDVIKLNRNVW